MDRDKVASVRAAIRQGEWQKPTAGLVPGNVQTNLVILPRQDALDFLLFALRNPKACPIIEVTDPGSPTLDRVAPGADVRTDLPKYRVYRRGVLEAEVSSIEDYWRDDLVTFLIGCSFTFENALLAAGVPVRHIEAGSNAPMYITNRPCVPAGMFHGPLVVSMRPVPADLVIKAIQITARFPRVHGAPVHFGDPLEIGVADLAKTDFGDAVTIREGEVPVFWACGVTPQAAAMEAKPEFMITHAPGYMFITDLIDQDLSL